MISLDSQIRTTKALIKFCEDHNFVSTRLELLKDCAAALEHNDVQRAVMINHQLPTGGNGALNDWWPPVVFPHETEEYVWAVFEALVTHWKLLMNLLEKQSP
jgi:hypothetical protein